MNNVELQQMALAKDNRRLNRTRFAQKVQLDKYREWLWILSIALALVVAYGVIITCVHVNQECESMTVGK